MNSPAQRAIVIGIDGASMELLLNMVQWGHVPHLAQLIEQGVYRPMVGVFPTLKRPGTRLMRTIEDRYVVAVTDTKRMTGGDSGDWQPEFRRRFLFLISFLAALTVAGTVAFLQFPEFSLSDAFYMTVITLTAVGYQEVHDLNDAGRMVAAVLLAGGITAMGLWFALITSTFVEMDLAHVFRYRRTMKRIGKIKDHLILCGAGRTGRQVIRELVAADAPYVVIEINPENAELIKKLTAQLSAGWRGALPPGIKK